MAWISGSRSCGLAGGFTIVKRYLVTETGPLSQGVQAGRKALRIRHMNGMEVRKKRPKGVKKRPRGLR
jgi:hypothetical protein